MGWCFVYSATRSRSYSSYSYDAYRAPAGQSSVIIPEGEKALDEDSFIECKEMVSVVIPKSVTQIKGNPFWCCPNLSSITVARGNRKFDSRDGCNAIIGKQTDILIVGCKDTIIPDSVCEIGENAFERCESLTAIDIPESVTRIGEHAFAGCTGLSSIVIPNSVNHIWIGAFSGCSGLKSIVLSNNISWIPKEAFYGCSGLSAIEIPDSVHKIDKDAFTGCSGLLSLMIPESVTSIEGNVFKHCTQLQSIKVAEANKYYDSREGCNAILSQEPGYRGYIVTGCVNSIIPYSISCIGDSAFEGCTNLLSIDIPDTISSIGMGAFEGCTGLSSIIVPHSIKRFEERIFKDCSSLTNISIPDSVEYIGNEAFRGCSGLTSVVIPPSVKTIGHGVLFGCSALETFTIPRNIESPYKEIYSTAIEDFILGRRSSELGFTAKKDNNTITFRRANKEIKKTENVRPIYEGRINNRLFIWDKSELWLEPRSYSDIKSIVIPEIVNRVLGFGGFRELKSVELPSHVKIICDDTFLWCTSLTSIFLPGSITDVGARVLARCSNLKTIYVPRRKTEYFKKLLPERLWPLIKEKR